MFTWSHKPGHIHPISHINAQTWTGYSRERPGGRVEPSNDEGRNLRAKELIWPGLTSGRVL
jgi:hypothetical protein